MKMLPDLTAELRLSPNGLISGIEASDRPRIEGKAIVERPWRGQFSDYRRFDGRWIPTRASVSWVLPAGEFVTWEGEMTRCELRSVDRLRHDRRRPPR